MFAKNFKNLRLAKELTQEQLAKDLGMSKSAVSMYETGRRSPDLATAELISDYFHVNIDELVTDTEFKNATDPLKLGFMAVPHTRKVPRLGAISCGQPIMSDENFDGFDDVPDHINCDFTLLAEGDSMIGARINDGDIVYIRQQPLVDNGQIAAVLVDGCDKLLKRVYITDSSIILQAENPAYPPLVFIGEDINRIKIIGRAVGFTSMLS